MLLTQLNLSVKAATTPSSGKFIPKSALETTDTKFGLCTGKTPQKVWFGKNGSNARAWWIAGYDSTTQGLVLLCDPNTIMNNSQVFLAQSKYDSSEPYENNTPYNKDPAHPANDLDWGCTYSSNAPTGKVFANHYGGSDIRAVLKGYETDTSKFSTAEQNMMKETTVWTWDKKNDNAFYSTTSKLYLGAGEYSYDTAASNHYFTVGANVVDTSESKTKNNATNNGLKVGLVAATGPEGSPYISGGQWFWLRSPSAGYGYIALTATIGRYVGSTYVRHSSRCVPAFALNLESVIFASAAAPAAASSALSDGVYLRFADDENKLGATATTSGRAVTVTKGSEGSGAEYLYIQGNDGLEDWVYSKKIEDTETLMANDIRASASSFAGCKVWIETTENNVTYAREIAVDGTMDRINIVNNCKAVVELHDKDNNPITTGISLTLKDSANNKVDTGAWSNSGTTFESEKTIPTGNYTLSVTWAENTLAQNEYPIVVNGAAQPVKLTKCFPLYVKVMDGSTVMTNEDDIRFTLSKGGEAINTSWSYNSDTKVFSSNKLLAEGNYDLRIAMHGSALSQTQWTVTVNGETVNECSLSKTYPVYIKLKDSLGNKITDADNMTVTMQKGEETPISLTYNTDNESFEPAKNVKVGTYTLTVTKPAGAKYELAQSEFEVRVARALDKTITITKQCPVHIELQDNIGRVITGPDAAGITLKLGATALSEDTTPGIFKADNIPEGSYTLTVTVNEGGSNYLTPKVTSYPIEIDADEPSTSANPHRIIRFKPGIVGTGRVITGVGGDAGYRYDRKSGVTKFYCNPAKGYKVDKIEKDSKGIVRYVSFKLV